MRFGQLIVLSCGAAMLPLLAGCKKEVVRAEPPPPKVTVAHPEERELIDYDQYNGWLEAAQTVEVRARVRGHIQKVDFTDGQLVKEGDPLFELDPRPFEADVGRERDQRAIYEAQLVVAQKEEARFKELLGRGGASQTQVDEAEAKTKSLEAELKANEQEIARKSLDLEYARITAPISGRVSRAMLTVGNLVNAGGSDPLLTTIVSVDPIYVYFPIDERALQRYQVQRIREGQTTRPSSLKQSQIPIKFGLETDTGFPHEGVMDFVDNQIDQTTGTITARAVAHDPNGRLLPGSRVRIRVPTSGQHTVTLLPDTALLSDQDKRYVLVLDDKNVVQRRDVMPGKLLDDGNRVILAGASGTALSTNDRVVVEGLQTARINYPVEPITPTTQPTQTASLDH
jgi:multidrug efflux system membrane fusion protein